MSPRAHRSTTRRAPPPARRRKASSGSGYRVAPRSRSRGRRSRIDWERAGRIALVLVLFGIVALYVNPVAGFVDAWQEKRAEQANLAELKRENAELEQRVEALSSSDGAAHEARKLGMVAEGERAYVIQSKGK